MEIGLVSIMAERSVLETMEMIVIEDDSTTDIEDNIDHGASRNSSPKILINTKNIYQD